MNKLWRHQQRTANSGSHHMPLNVNPHENFLRTPVSSILNSIIMKSNNRPFSKRVENVLCPALSCINPGMDDLCKNHQVHSSQQFCLISCARCGKCQVMFSLTVWAPRRIPNAPGVYAPTLDCNHEYYNEKRTCNYWTFALQFHNKKFENPLQAVAPLRAPIWEPLLYVMLLY